MSKIQEKIKTLMDIVQESLESQRHIESPEEFMIELDKVGLYFSHMNDEDRDYYQAAQIAFEEQRKWTI